MHIKISDLNDIEFPKDDISIKEEMYNDTVLCAQCRFICGKENTFFESLFKAYKLGGWKNGNIIVYVPADK